MSRELHSSIMRVHQHGATSSRGGDGTAGQAGDSPMMPLVLNAIAPTGR